LGRGGQKELVAGAIWTTEPQSSQFQNAFEVRKQHLDLLSLSARDDIGLRLGEVYPLPNGNKRQSPSPPTSLAARVFQRNRWKVDIRSSRRNDANARNRHSRELALPSIERQGRIEAWIVTDTGFRTIRKRLTVALANPSRDVHAVSRHPDHMQLDCI
jgi:hypothetical protein